MPQAVDAPATVAYEDNRRRSLFGYLYMPLILGGVLLALYLWVDSKDLDSIESRRVNIDFLTTAAIEHIRLTVVSTILVLGIAIPAGVLLTRPFARTFAAPLTAIFNIGQATPSIGVIALAALLWTIGFWPSITALVAYSALPVLRNTIVGLQQVDETIIESAQGMGMSKIGSLLKIELPLAVPVILAGVRTALVINVGTATLATYINAGGLGDVINTGLTTGRPLVTVVGGVLTAVLALTVDYVAGLIEDLLRPRGL